MDNDSLTSSKKNSSVEPGTDSTRSVLADTNCKDLKGHFKGAVFFNCLFDNLNGLTLEDCDLNRSQFITSKIEDALGFTVTLNCNSFSNVEISPLLFDLMLCLLLKSKGNTEKRKKLLDVLGKDRAHELLQQLATLE